MRPPFYLRQLKRDIDHWIELGLVPAENKEEMLASVGALKAGGRLESIIAVFGAILIGLGALSFVGANWASMDKFERLVVLFGSMWLAYGAAVWFYLSDSKLIGQAFVLLGVLLFGSNIWFVAQTYNINSHYPDGTLLWGAGALAAGMLIPSRATLGAAFAIAGYWTWQETFDFDKLVHLAYLPFWAIAAASAAWWAWRPGIHLAALSIIYWFVISYGGLQSALGWSDAEILSVYVFVPLAIWSVTQIHESGENGLTLTAGHYAFFVFLGAFSVLHLAEGHALGSTSSWMIMALAASSVSLGGVALSLQRKGATGLDVLGTLFALGVTIAYVTLARDQDDRLDIVYLACTLVVILWSLSRGARLDDTFVVNWSVVAFGIWVLYTYFKLFEDLLLTQQAAFFTIGGIILIALALGLERLRRSLVGAAKSAGRS